MSQIQVASAGKPGKQSLTERPFAWDWEVKVLPCTPMKKRSQKEKRMQQWPNTFTIRGNTLWKKDPAGLPIEKFSTPSTRIHIENGRTFLVKDNKKIPFYLKGHSFSDIRITKNTATK